MTDMIDMVAHLTRQAAASRGIFGPGTRTEGILQHIEKEAEEVRKAVAADDLDEAVKEWTDIVVLGLDGLLRAVKAREDANPLNQSLDEQIDAAWVATDAVLEILHKQGKNELRDWPDWRTMSPDVAIEHDRTQGVQ